MWKNRDGLYKNNNITDIYYHKGQGRECGTVTSELIITVSNRFQGIQYIGERQGGGPNEPTRKLLSEPLVRKFVEINEVIMFKRHEFVCQSRKN